MVRARSEQETEATLSGSLSKFLLSTHLGKDCWELSPDGTEALYLEQTRGRQNETVTLGGAPPPRAPSSGGPGADTRQTG